MDEFAPTDYLQEWRAADKAASAAEKAVLAASLASIERRGPPPDEAAVADARRKRGVANDLFKVAMDVIRDQANKLKR